MISINKKRLKIFFGIFAALVLLVVGYFYYNKNISRTKIAFVNYSSFQLAKIQRSNPGKMIKIVDLPVDQLKDLRHYDAVFVFGRGLVLDPDQFDLLKNASYTNLPVYVESANNPNFDVSNLKGKDLDNVEDYFKFGGTANYHNLLNYVRVNLDHKKWFVEAPKKPVEIPKDVLFYLDEEKVFTSVKEFSAYALQKGFHKAGRPNIALLTGVPGPFNSNRDHIDSIIVTMQRKGWNIFPLASATKRLEWLKQIKPDLLVLMPHGRMVTQGNDQLAGWLKENNVPVLAALSAFENYDKWKKDPQGYSGSLLTMNITLPELDGAIVPYVVSAQFKDKNGFDIFKAIPNRLEKFCTLASGFLKLKTKANRDKKVAIYYFKGPGMSSMTAANMEVVPSLYNTLKALKAAGYTVDHLPATEGELAAQIQKNGLVLNPYAEGNISKFLQESNPALVSTDQYKTWADKTLSKNQNEAVIEKYGQAPGAYLSSYKNGKENIAVARLQFGNVVLLPQPLPGVGNDSFKLVHGAKVAPPYPYIASYLWTRYGFGADAIIHFGTHGSLEFTPGKQVGLSDDDWSDALISTIPNFYVYTMSNIGEGIIAKRRTYSTLISHLTPPFSKGGTVNELAVMEENLHKWVNFENGPMKSSYAKSISEKAKKLGLYKAIKADIKTDLTDDQLRKLAQLVEEIDNEKIINGLYTIGKPYSAEELNSTVKQMAIDPIAYNLAKVNMVKGTEKSGILEDQVTFTQKYRKQASTWIDQELAHPSGILPLSKTDLERAEKWAKSHQSMDESAIIRGFIAMGSKRRGKPDSAAPKDKASSNMLTNLVVKIKPYPEKVNFINSLKSDKRMKEATGLLDPATLERAKVISKAIPKMKEAIQTAQDKDVNALLKLMLKESDRQKVFALLEDKSLTERVKTEQKKIYNQTLKEASSPEKLNVLKVALSNNWISLPLEKLYVLAENLDFYEHNRNIYTNVPSSAVLNKQIKAIRSQIGKLEDKESEFSKAVLAFKNTFDNLSLYKNALKNSTSAELNSLINGLGGGFISTSTGGDAISAPDALPTGRNMYGIDAEKTPSEEAWKVGRQLGQQLLQNHLKQHGHYPKKVSFTLWASDFIKTEGATVAEIFYLLGVEPVRDPMNRVQSLRLIPTAVLGRPRVDVVVQTSGQFRDLGASRMALINQAVAMAAAAPQNDKFENYVRSGVSLSEKILKEKGLSPKEARELSTLRVFGGVDGNYGTNIMGMTEAGDKWNNREEIAKTYINNMGAAYGDTAHWAEFKAGLFEAALQNTEVVVQPRENNTWGPLSLDHVYEFMGGLNLAVKQVTGKQPDTYFNDFRNVSNARIQDAKEAIWVEAQSTILNPNYIKSMMKGGASSAETFAETLRNTYGWNVMKEDAIDQELWNNINDVYVKDVNGLGTVQFFKDKNPYALQEMTGVLVEAYRKGMWKANAEQIKAVSNLHANLVKSYNAGCSEFICGNKKISETVSANLSAADKQSYSEKIKEAVSGSSSGAQNAKNTVLKAQNNDNQPTQETKKNISASLSGSGKYIAIAIVLVIVVLLLRLRKKKLGEE